MSDEGSRPHEPHAVEEAAKRISDGPPDDHYVDRMQALARRWDLKTLQRDLLDAMGKTSVGRSVHVPSRLVAALDMFLDSYGGKPGGID